MHNPEALEVVDRDRRLWRIDGVLHRVPRETLTLLDRVGREAR